jgi:hypothetical protein
MVTEPLTSMEILIAHGRHQSKRTLHSMKQTMAVKLKVGTLNLGCDFCGLYNSREGDVHCDSVSSELELPRRSDPRAFKRIECDINLYEWYFAMREISDEE